MTSTRQTVELSPDVAAILDAGRDHVRAHTRRDRTAPIANPRVSLRLDCPLWLRLATGELAAELDTSISQLADWLIAYALLQYRAGDTGVRELLDLCRNPGRALRFGSFMDLDEMHDRLVQAEASSRGASYAALPWSLPDVRVGADMDAPPDEDTGADINAAINAAIPSRAPVPRGATASIRTPRRP
jgi:hypothetical protein